MSSCEKCWRDSRPDERYSELLESRKDNPCTPEEQAGPDAAVCPKCGRMTLHQHTGECMTGCKDDTRKTLFDDAIKIADDLVKERNDLRTQLAAATKRRKAAEDALREIAKGEGRFSRDQLTHANNTIEDMIAIANTTLDGFVLIPADEKET